MRLRQLFSLALVFVASSLVSSATAATLTENVDKTFDVVGGTAELVLSNTNGGITIASWDQPRIRVHAEKRVEGSREDAAKAMRELQVKASASGRTVNVETVEPESGAGGFFDMLFGHHVNTSVRYEITVPRAANLKVDNTNGNIRISEVTGEHNVETTNGRIELARCAGSLDASTTNGAIRAELLQVNSSRSVHCETTNGSITLTLPANLAADVDAETTNGRIHSDLPVVARVIDDNALRGAINGGGPDLRLRTTNGSISIATVDAVAR